MVETMMNIYRILESTPLHLHPICPFTSSLSTQRYLDTNVGFIVYVLYTRYL